MTVDEFLQLGIELELVPPGNSLRIVAAAKPVSDEERARIVSFLPGLLAELRLRERSAELDGHNYETQTAVD